ncbi:MAG: M23 family metallopeptidase [Brevundimonas sp.]
MADLTKTPTRRTSQDRITNNRDNLIPRARNTDLATPEIRADLRNAVRGDGGNELARALGMAGEAAESYYRADIAKTAEQAEKDYAEGLSDAAGGQENDPEMAKSIAYQRAFHGTTAAKAQSDFERETAEAATALINQGGTDEDVQALFDERGAAFIQETIDRYDDPEIKQRVAVRMVNWSNERTTAALTLMKERSDTELIENTQSELQNRLQRNEPLDFEATMQPLIAAGMDPVRVRTALVDSTVAYAIETRNTDVLYELLDSRREGDVEAIPYAGNPAVTEEIEGAPLAPVGDAAPAPAAPPAARVSYVMPVLGEVSSGIGRRRAPLPGASTNHGGIDIPVPVGTPVAAMGPGRVVFAGRRGNNGNLVVIEHEDGSRSSYAHLDSIGVEQGQTVAGGAQIARSGNTGNSTGPHLHLSFRDASGRTIDARTVVGQNAGSNPSAPPASTGPSREDLVAAARSPNGPPVRDRPSGTSSLSAADQQRVVNAIVQVEGLADRDNARWKEESRDALILRLDEVTTAGGDITPLLREAQAEGYLDPIEANSLDKTFRGIDDYTEEGRVNEDLVLDYQLRFAVEKPNYGQIRAQAQRDFDAGRFGTGRAARSALINILTASAQGQRGERESDPVARAGQQNYRSFVSQSLATVVTERLGPGINPSTGDRRNLVLADQEYEQLIASGVSPQAAADQVVNKWTPLLSNAPAGSAPPQVRTPGGQQPRQPGSAPRRVRVNQNGEIIGD